MLNNKSIIFDLDGTLIDSSEGFISAIMYTIKVHNLKTLPETQLINFIGPPIQDSLKHTYNITERQAQIYADTFRNRYKKKDVYKAKIYNKIINLLEDLKSKHYKLGIATYKREDYSVSLLKHLNLYKYFDSICGADNENKLGKKDILYMCIKNLNSQSGNTIFVGDSLSDGLAAKDLGCKFIAVTYGFGFKSQDEINASSPILVAHNPEEIGLIKEIYA